MKVLHVTHPSGERHDTPPGHPERPARLRAVWQAVEGLGLAELSTVEAPAVADDLLEAVHRRSYIAHVDMLAAAGGGWLDADTSVGVHSARAARHAAGAAQRAAEALCAGEAPRAFVAVRPPGHHALPDRGMGFCLFNNAAVAATAARRAGKARVMIVDWDVHHGNGTQAIFLRDPSVLFVSVHQEYWYPGTGAVEEVGEGPGEGFTVNVPLPAQTGDGGYQDVFTEIVLPLAHAWRPELLVVSAGYDAHFADPLGGMVVTARGFARLTTLLDEAARALDAPVLAVLEGGYDLEALAASAAATVAVLAGRGAGSAPIENPPPEAPPAAIWPRVREARRVLLHHWRL